MKKIYMTIIIGVLALSMIGCGAKAAEPAVEPVTEPVAEQAAEPAAEPATEPAAEPATEPAAEPEAEPATEPAAASDEESKSNVLGEIKDNAYLNDFVGFEMKLPSSWSFYDEADILDDNGATSLDDLDVEMLEVLYGLDENQYASVQVNLEILDGILYSTVKEFMDFDHDLSAEVYDDYVVGDVTEMKIGGLDGYFYSAVQDQGGYNHIIDTYASERNGYAIYVVFDYYDDDASDVEAIKDMMDSVVFK